MSLSGNKSAVIDRILQDVNGALTPTNMKQYLLGIWFMRPLKNETECGLAQSKTHPFLCTTADRLC
jgi:hypothetical protein